MDGSNTKRIVLLGKTGTGKSSLANTIFGEDVFKINNTVNSGTSECRAETRSVSGRSITLIDTPGFFDTDRSEEELRPEIVRCITECAPGPHAFLIVLKVERFTEHEQAVINKIQEYFSEEAFEYTTVVFTHGDQLTDGQTIESFVQQNKSVSDLVEKCGGRCHVVDNKYWSRNPEDEYRNNQFQVKELLNTIDKMVTENNGRCYTNEMLQAVEREIQQEVEDNGQTSDDKIRKEAKRRVSTKLSVRLAGIATGVLLGALCGLAVLAVVAFMGLKAAGGGGAIGGTPVVVGVIGACAAVGATAGGFTGYYAAEGAETPGEAAKNTFEAFKEGAESVKDLCHTVLKGEKSLK